MKRFAVAGFHKPQELPVIRCAFTKKFGGFPPDLSELAVLFDETDNLVNWGTTAAGPR